MFLDQLVVGRSIDAIDLVGRNKTFDPLDLISKFAKNAARGLRNVFELVVGELPRTRNIPFDYVLWHLFSLCVLHIDSGSVIGVVSPEMHFATGELGELALS